MTFEKYKTTIKLHCIIRYMDGMNRSLDDIQQYCLKEDYPKEYEFREEEAIEEADTYLVENL